MTGTYRYNKVEAVTPSASVDFLMFQQKDGRLTDALYVGGAGVVAVVFQDGTAQNFTCVAGQILPVQARRVNATSTATLMVALYQL